MRFVVIFLSLLAGTVGASESAPETVFVGEPAKPCAEDPQCFNRLHPAIPMVARAKPGQTIVLRTRNAFNIDLSKHAAGDAQAIEFGSVHPLTGPVHIEGAKAGDTLAVTLAEIEPGDHGITLMSPFGFAAEYVTERQELMWRLRDGKARSDALPGVVIPDASFPGVITTLPGPEQLSAILARETALAEAGGDAFGPDPGFAVPAAVCGADGSHPDECVRTIPPREHGGNLDIRYLGEGVTIYLPCYIDGCGLGMGDMHYAQGDGEVAGTAIEIDADITLTTRVIEGGMAKMKEPRYEGPARLLDIPSERFYATTGIPVKAAGDVPPEMAYLESGKVAGLENLSRDINLAARNALNQMIEHIQETYGLERWQAHVVASVAVDLRIGQLVDTPNVGVTAILPLDIFEEVPGSDEE